MYMCVRNNSCSVSHTLFFHFVSIAVDWEAGLATAIQQKAHALASALLFSRKGQYTQPSDFHPVAIVASSTRIWAMQLDRALARRHSSPRPNAETRETRTTQGRQGPSGLARHGNDQPVGMKR